jgi:hypothetical protein
MSDSPLAVVRASSWGELFDCAARWHFKNVLGLRLPSSGQSALGTALHRGTAVYDKRRMLGEDAQVNEAIDATIDAVTRPEMDVAWDEDDLSRDKAAAVGMMLTKTYVEQIGSRRRFDAVELECNALDVETDAGTVRLTGTTDRVYQTADGRFGIGDLKTGKRAVHTDGVAETKGHGLQVGVYQIMAQHASGERMTAPAQIVGLHTAPTRPRVGIGEIPDATRSLLGTSDKPGLIEVAASMFKSGLFPPNPKSNLCSAKWCPGYSRCPYHE